jgi:NDP-sugar pyrophosphorylase family protein
MIALVLAAGRGERLRPHTDNMPKPMIRIGSKPILQHNVELLVAAGIRDIVINLHHHPDSITEYFGDGNAFGARITYALEPALLGTAGAARNVAGRIGGRDFLVVYGDNLSTIDLEKLIALHREREAALTMALFHRDDTAASGIVDTDDDGRITRFLEKPQPHEVFSHWVNAGYYAVAPSVLDVIPPGVPSDFARDVLPELLRRNARLYGYRMSEQLWWIDSLADFERTEREFS